MDNTEDNKIISFLDYSILPKPGRLQNCGSGYNPVVEGSQLSPELEKYWRNDVTMSEDLFVCLAFE
jgi:hypothetical protein